MAASSSVEDFEYVTQFFGFTPKSFADGVYNAINDYIQECFKEMGTILEEEFAKKDNLSSSQIRSGCKGLIKKCYRNLDQFMDNMELYMLRNIFIIPGGVLLPEDKVHEEMKGLLNESGSKSECDIDLEILELKDRIRKEILFKKMLQIQHEKLKEVLADRERLEKWFDDMDKEMIEKNIQEDMNIVCENILEMKDVLENQRQMNTVS